MGGYTLDLILVENLFYKMRKLFVVILLPFFSFSQKMFVDNSHVDFFSAAPLEDISAISNKLEGVVDFSTGNFFFRIPISSFIFPSSLMQKHFNEKYMESDIYSISSFQGNFSDSISLIENKKILISSKGELSVHGIDQDVAIQTELIIEDSQVQFSSEFYIALKDYKIKVPKIVRMNIADTILVNVSGNLIIK